MYENFIYVYNCFETDRIPGYTTIIIRPVIMTPL